MPDQAREKTSAKDRHERFAREYVIDHQARRAYRAVYDPDGRMLKGVVDANASRLLKAKGVREWIDRLQLESHARLEITKDKLEKHLAEVTFVDLRDFYDEDGTLLAPKRWTKEMAAAVKSIDSEELFSGKGEERRLIGYTKTITLKDSVTTAALLGAPHGIGVKRVEVGKPGDFSNDDVETVRKRVVARSARLGLKLVKR